MSACSLPQLYVCDPLWRPPSMGTWLSVRQSVSLRISSVPPVSPWSSWSTLLPLGPQISRRGRRVWAGGAGRVLWRPVWPQGPRAAPAGHWACPRRFYIKRCCHSPALCRHRAVAKSPPGPCLPPSPAEPLSPPGTPALAHARGKAREGSYRGSGREHRDLERPSPPAGPATLLAPTHPRGVRPPKPRSRLMR